MPPSLAIIIVSWNVCDLLRRCLRATEASLVGGGVDYEIFVVDNASHDGTPAMLRAEFPEVRLIEPGANLGFAGGNNMALRALLARPVEDAPTYALLLNPDAEPAADALLRLVQALQQRPELAAIGPRLVYGDGTPQPSRRRFPSAATLFWESTPLERRWPGNPWARRYRYADRPDDQEQLVDWLVGAALLVRLAAIRRAGLLDERFFMYSEELEWQFRLQTAWGGGPGAASVIGYLPAALVVHHEGQSSEQALAARQLNFSRSRMRLARMWYGWRLAGLLRIYLRTGFAAELAAEALKLMLGHRPSLRRRRIAEYRQVLREL
jgi:N-acetylglucosaminyl-diphospho-decaprenol L-rhamnosyltransferase